MLLCDKAEAQILKTGEERAKERIKIGYQSVYALINKGGHVELSRESSCHGSMWSTGKNSSYAVVCGIDIKDKFHQEFFNWLITESPWSNVFREEELNRQDFGGSYLVAYTDMHCQHLAGGCIAYRFMREFHSSVIAFKHMYYKLGMSFNEIFFWREMVSMGETGKYTIRSAPPSYMHSAISIGYMTKASLQMFFQGLHPDWGDKIVSYQEEGSLINVGGVHKFWGETWHEETRNSLFRSLKEIAKKHQKVTSTKQAWGDGITVRHLNDESLLAANTEIMKFLEV